MPTKRSMCPFTRSSTSTRSGSTPRDWWTTWVRPGTTSSKYPSLYLLLSDYLCRTTSAADRLTKNCTCVASWFCLLNSLLVSWKRSQLKRSKGLLRLKSWSTTLLSKNHSKNQFTNRTHKFQALNLTKTNLNERAREFLLFTQQIQKIKTHRMLWLAKKALRFRIPY